jgi:hypothetical protein
MCEEKERISIALENVSPGTQRVLDVAQSALEQGVRYLTPMSGAMLDRQRPVVFALAMALPRETERIGVSAERTGWAVAHLCSAIEKLACLNLPPRPGCASPLGISQMIREHISIATACLFFAFSDAELKETCGFEIAGEAEMPPGVGAIPPAGRMPSPAGEEHSGSTDIPAAETAHIRRIAEGLGCPMHEAAELVALADSITEEEGHDVQP